MRGLGTAVVAAILLVPGAAYTSSHPAQFNVPDGRWWLNANFDEKYGFLIGEESCFVKKALHGSSYVNDPGIYSNIKGNYYDKIDNQIRRNRDLLQAPVTTAIRQVIRYHKK